MAITIGKGLQGTSGSQQIFGYSLPNYLSYTINDTIGEGPWSIINQTSSFDLSSITPDHEVIAALS